MKQINNNVKIMFLLPTVISTVTLFVLFALLYSTTYHYSSYTCVNYPPQLNPYNNNNRQRSLEKLDVALRANVRNDSTPASMFVPSGNATVAPPLNATQLTSDGTVPKPEVDYRSWHEGVLTSIRPTLRQNCTKLSLGDKDELGRTKDLLKRLEFSVSANFSTCEQIREEFSNNFYVSQTEKDFPLAFVLIVHTNANQILRFLKVIYRPQNVYCFHPDPRNKEFFETFRRVASCLPNVRIASRLHHVKYHRPSTIFKAQMSCFRDLYDMKGPKKWKYVINLCGREIPLKTNRRIVEDLMKLKGKSVIKPHPIDRFTLDTCFSNVRNRVSRDHKKCTAGRDVHHVSISAIERCEPFLKNFTLRLYKSMTYNAYSREFVRFFLHDERVVPLQEWIVKNCRTPEEHYYAMASVIPGAPGGNSSAGPNELGSETPSVFKTIWYHDKRSPHHHKGQTCASGRVVHSVCIANSAELPRVYDAMTQTNAWFFNKYFMEEDHIVMDCVETEIGKTNRLEYEKDHRR